MRGPPVQVWNSDLPAHLCFHIFGSAFIPACNALSLCFSIWSWLLPRWHGGKEPACQCRRHKRRGFDPWVRKITWRRKWQPAPVFLPGKSHGQRSLAGYSPQGHKSQTRLSRHHHFLPGLTKSFPLLILPARSGVPLFNLLLFFS